MGSHDVPESQVEVWLEALGIDTLTQWDLLVFLYRHRTSLVGAEFIARLLGYATATVVAALDVLASLKLVERSRAFQGVRLYQLALPDGSPQRDAFVGLTAVAASRAGRLQLYKKLKPRDQTAQQQHAAQRFLAEARQIPQAVQRRLQPVTEWPARGGAKKREQLWRKAM